nr:pentatricopeptide repeat-containing protein [Quercus suber]
MLAREKKEQLEECLELVEGMWKIGCIPDLSTYNTVIRQILLPNSCDLRKLYNREIVAEITEKVDKAIAEKRDDLQAIQANECNEEDVCGEQQIREQLEELMRKEEIMWD